MRLSRNVYNLVVSAVVKGGFGEAYKKGLLVGALVPKKKMVSLGKSLLLGVRRPVGASLGVADSGNMQG